MGWARVFCFGLVREYFWWERIQTSASFTRSTGSPFMVGLIRGLVAIGHDCAGERLQLRGSVRVNRIRGWWKSAGGVGKKCATILKAQMGEKIFLMLTLGDRVSEIAFYLRDKRSKARGIRPGFIPNRDM